MRQTPSIRGGAAFMSGIMMGFLLLAPPVARAGENRAGRNFAAIDRHALATPKSAERSVASLAAYLTRPARTELEKARGIFRWVTKNIAYDADAYFSRRFRNSRATPGSVLRTRKGVCDGYARIYEGLAKAAGLEVVRVSGFAKGFGFELGDEVPKESNHAWNAVKVEGRWILVDSTWGAGAVSAESRSFIRAFGEHYFQTDPEQMIYSHLPEDPKWQLLNKEVSRNKFAILPKLRPLFFQHKLELQSHKDGEIKTGERLRISLKVPADSELHARVVQKERNLDRSLSYVKREGDRFTVNALFPKAGEYTLRIFVRPVHSTGSFGGAMDYLVRASKGTTERFPLYYRPFFDHGLKLDSHRNGIIETDKQAEVSLLVPPDVELTAGIYRNDKELEKTLSYLRREGSRYRIHSLYPRPGTYQMRIFSRPAASKGVYHMALEYEVRVGKGTAERFPKYGTAFFDHGLKLESHPNGLIKTGGTLELRLGAPPAVALIASLLRKEKKVPGNLLHIQRDGGSYLVNAIFPKRGQYTLRIFVNDKGGKGSYQFAMEYTVAAARGAGAQAGFPVFYGKYNEQGALLLAPMEGNLKAGSIQKFRLKVPGATHVAVVVGKKWTQLSRKGGEFQGEVPIAKGKINVFANFTGGQGSYAGLLQYTGR